MQYVWNEACSGSDGLWVVTGKEQPVRSVHPCLYGKGIWTAK
jgi:hypothetical protein